MRKPLRNPLAEGELWQCTSASLPQTKDTRGVVEMLLMIAGDVEPNPGPSKLSAQVFHASIFQEKKLILMVVHQITCHSHE